MKQLGMLIFLITVLIACDPSKKQQENKSIRDTISVSFNYERSNTDFTISDSSGFNITFHKQLDSTTYHHFRFRTPEKEEFLYPNLPVLSQLWLDARQQIDIKLTSFNIGYPLEYEDVLTNQIQSFAASDKWLNHVRVNGKKPDYELIEEIMFSNNIYALNELVEDFNYGITGFSIEKVGFVEPERLVGLGFDESLTIPVPYIVWINIIPSIDYGL